MPPWRAQVFSHYASCHAVMEATAVVAARQLSALHPLLRLLRPHFEGTLAINTLARSSLISPGGSVDQQFGLGPNTVNKLATQVGHATQRPNVPGQRHRRSLTLPVVALIRVIALFIPLFFYIVHIWVACFGATPPCCVTAVPILVSN